MDKLDIEIFQTIINEKSIQKAADFLYMSPTTVGSRLKSLERELGVELIERKKGIKTVSLTDQGTHFAVLARQMLSLMNACERLHHEEMNVPLTIATADSYLQHNLVPLYRRITQDPSLFPLDIQLYPSDMVYPLVSCHSANIGFALYKVNYTDVIATPLFTDDVVVVVPSSSPYTGSSIHPKDLDPSKEYFIGSDKNQNVGWGAVFNAWHRENFNIDATPRLRVNSVSILSYFLDDKDYWTLLPRTLTTGYQSQHDLKIIELEAPAPKRTCYMLTNPMALETTKKEMDLFCQYLYSYLQELEGITLLF